MAELLTQGAIPKPRLRVWLVAGIVSAALLAAVLTRLDYGTARRLLAEARSDRLLLALAVAAASYLVTTYRLVRSFAGSRPTAFAPALDVNVIHSALLVLLPARLGDVYYPVLLSRRLGAPFGVAVANLVLLRVIDALVVAALFLISALVLATADRGAPVGVTVAAGLLILGGLATLWALPALTRCAARVALRFRTHRAAVTIFRHAAAAARWLRTHSARSRSELFVLTAAAWGANAAVFWIIFWALGVALSAPAIVFVAAGFSLAGALPLQSVGGFGVAEASLSLLLVLIGMPVGQAAAAAVLARLALLMIPLVLWTLWFGPKWLRSRVRGGR